MDWLQASDEAERRTLSEGLGFLQQRLHDALCTIDFFLLMDGLHPP
jgi:hypothetical protein